MQGVYENFMNGLGGSMENFYPKEGGQRILNDQSLILPRGLTWVSRNSCTGWGHRKLHHKSDKMVAYSIKSCQMVEEKFFWQSPVQEFLLIHGGLYPSYFVSVFNFRGNEVTKFQIFSYRASAKKWPQSVTLG